MAASSSQDPLFEVVLCQLPEVLEAGLRAAGMADPAILESLMTGHGDTVVLGIRIRLLLVWTLEAYHYRFRYLFLFLSFVLRLFSFLSAPSSCINHTQNENCIYPLVD